MVSKARLRRVKAEARDYDRKYPQRELRSSNELVIRGVRLVCAWLHEQDLGGLARQVEYALLGAPK